VVLKMEIKDLGVRLYSLKNLVNHNEEIIITGTKLHKDLKDLLMRRLKNNYILKEEWIKNEKVIDKWARLNENVKEIKKEIKETKTGIEDMKNQIESLKDNKAFKSMIPTYKSILSKDYDRFDVLKRQLDIAKSNIKYEEPFIKILKDDFKIYIDSLT